MKVYLNLLEYYKVTVFLYEFEEIQLIAVKTRKQKEKFVVSKFTDSHQIFEMKQNITIFV